MAQQRSHVEKLLKDLERRSTDGNERDDARPVYRYVARLLEAAIDADNKEWAQALAPELVKHGG